MDADGHSAAMEAASGDLGAGPVTPEPNNPIGGAPLVEAPLPGGQDGATTPVPGSNVQESPASSNPSPMDPAVPPAAPENADSTTSEKTAKAKKSRSSKRSSPERQKTEKDGDGTGDSSKLSGSKAALWDMALKGATEEEMRRETGLRSPVDSLMILAANAGREVKTSRENGVRTFSLGG